MTIVLIIVGVVVLFVIIRMAMMFRSDDDLEAGGSYGRQLRTPKEDEPPDA